MSFNLMQFVDPHKFYYESINDTIDKINNVLPLKKNLNDKSLFRFYYDDYLIQIFKYEHDITNKTFVTINIDLIKEAKSRNLDIMLIFDFNGLVYFWKYDDKDICIGYNFNGSDKIPKYIHIMTNKLKLFDT